MSPSRLLSLPLNALAWVGRHGTRALAALVLLSVALPWVGHWLKPYVSSAIFVLLSMAFLRVDMAALRGHLRRPGVVVAGALWTSVCVPISFGMACHAAGLHEHAGGLFVSLMLQAITAPLMSGPALALLMGLDATLVLATLILSTAMMPITAPLFAHVFIGPGLSLAPWSVGAKLAVLLAGSAALAGVLRRVMGAAAIERHKKPLDGANVLMLFVLLASMMEGVPARFMASPMEVVGLTLLAFAVFGVLLIVTTLLFFWAGRSRALSMGFLASQRNMGLMLAATGGAVPELTWVYFGLAQVPIYLSPLMLKPLIRRCLAPLK